MHVYIDLSFLEVQAKVWCKLPLWQHANLSQLTRHCCLSSWTWKRSCLGVCIEGYPPPCPPQSMWICYLNFIQAEISNPQSCLQAQCCHCQLPGLSHTLLNPPLSLYRHWTPVFCSGWLEGRRENTYYKTFNQSLFLHRHTFGCIQLI